MNNSNLGNGASAEGRGAPGRLVEQAIRRDVPQGSHFDLEDILELLGGECSMETVSETLQQMEQRAEILKQPGSEPPEYRRIR